MKKCRKFIFIIGIIAVMLFSINIISVSAATTYDCSNPHPDWIFCEDFESGTLVSNGWYYNYPGSTYFPTCSSTQPCAEITNSESHTGSKSMRGLSVPGGASNDNVVAHHLFTAQAEVYVRYYRKWESSWRWDYMTRSGHNTYIFAGKYTNPMTTDFTVYEDTHYRNKQSNFAVRGAYQNASELIVPEGTTYDGQWPALPHDVASPVTFVPGSKWYEIQYMAKMNTPGKKDGEIKLWIEGVLVTDQTNLLLRDSKHSNIKFDHFLFGPNYPGGKPPYPQSNYIDDIVISTSYIPSSGAPADVMPPNAPQIIAGP